MAFGDRNPAQVTAWRRRGAERWQRNRQSRPSKRKKRKTIPANIRRQVYGRHRGRCFVCLSSRAVQVHHFLAVQSFPKLELEPDNMGGICASCHVNHEFSPSGRIAREQLPDCALQLAMRVGGPAIGHIERHYPASASDERVYDSMEVEKEAPAALTRPGARHQESGPSADAP